MQAETTEESPDRSIKAIQISSQIFKIPFYLYEGMADVIHISYVEPVEEGSIEFDLNFDISVWGITENNINPNGTIDICLTIVGEDEAGAETREEKTVVVDLSELTQNIIVSEGRLSIGNLTLYLDQYEQVDYENSSVEVMVLS